MKKCKIKEIKYGTYTILYCVSSGSGSGSAKVLN
jgi:hypothetical protein